MKLRSLGVLLVIFGVILSTGIQGNVTGYSVLIFGRRTYLSQTYGWILSLTGSVFVAIGLVSERRKRRYLASGKIAKMLGSAYRMNLDQISRMLRSYLPKVGKWERMGVADVLYKLTHGEERPIRRAVKTIYKRARKEIGTRKLGKETLREVRYVLKHALGGKKKVPEHRSIRKKLEPIEGMLSDIGV